MICVDGRRNFFDAELERHGLHGTVALYDFSFSFVLLCV
jgi:hypothetical protein